MWSGRIKKQKSRSAKNEKYNAWFDYANKYVSKILWVTKYQNLVILSYIAGNVEYVIWKTRNSVAYEITKIRYYCVHYSFA